MDTPPILRPRCPACGKYLFLPQAPFACQSSSEICAPLSDPVYASERGLVAAPRRSRLTPPLDRLQSWRRKYSATPWLVRLLSVVSAMMDVLVPIAEVNCVGCGRPTRQRVCPHCHDELPDNIGTHDNLRIAIIGPPGAGKSHLLAAQAECLERLLGASLGMTVRPVGRTRQSLVNQARRRVFEQRRTLAPTHRLAIAQDVRDPLVYELTAERLGLMANLVLFDLSGEDCLDEKALVGNGRHIVDADAFLVLTPANPLDVADPIDSRTRDVIDTLFAAAARCGRPLNKLSRAPVALVVSKTDRLAARGVLDPRLSDGVRYQDRVRSDLLTSTMEHSRETLMKSETGALLVQSLELRFRNVGCFVVSGLGTEPDSSGHIVAVNPHRVEEPLLWLLKMSGLMRAGL
jgi:hypothetical protein